MGKHTARTSRAGNSVLSRSFIAGTVEGVFLAAGALRLGSADTTTVSRGIAAGGVGVDHFVVVVVGMYDVRF